METKSITIGAIGLLIGLVLGFTMMPRYPEMGMHRMKDGREMANGSMMHDSMQSMMVGLNGKTGDAFDQAFLLEMIVHHEGAVEMAEAALQNAKHEEIKTMARAIISAQTSEISQMKQWLGDWYGR